ncbi:MAG: [FeFe] hydrogenase H-cluster radical SAM maturase HydE [Bacteroidales bacterium]
MGLREIIMKAEPRRDDLEQMLTAEGDARFLLRKSASEIRNREIGNRVHFRGLIEFSNICGKDCYYCGIRRSNRKVHRYNLSDDQILEAARFAHQHHYGSLVLQSGEVESPAFTERIEYLLREIKKLSGGSLGITLSLGEQEMEVYRRWYEAGAHRYLLRIETSSPRLYRRLHPEDPLHNFDRRLQCLASLRSIGYQTGTGVMIGLPFQETGDLADDLLFMKAIDIDMVGMGPYIEHPDTPLFGYRQKLIPIEQRFELALNMIASLRHLMPDINIAAATALQAIDPLGREKAVKAGANVIMPNIIPGKYRNDYSLYENKPCVGEEPEECLNCLDVRVQLADSMIGYGEWGDSLHFHRRSRPSNG